MLTKIWVECHDLALNLCMSNLHSIDTNLLSVNLRAVASPFLWVTNELELVAAVVETCERAASEVKKRNWTTYRRCCITQVNYMNFSEVRIECVGPSTGEVECLRWTAASWVVKLSHELVKTCTRHSFIFSKRVRIRWTVCNLAMWCTGLHFICNFTNLNMFKLII